MYICIHYVTMKSDIISYNIIESKQIHYILTRCWGSRAKALKALRKHKAKRFPQIEGGGRLQPAHRLQTEAQAFLTRRSLYGPDGNALRGALEAGGPWLQGAYDDDGTVEFYGWNFMVQLFNQKMRASLWKKCSSRVTPEKRTFIPQPRFSCFLLVICDNWICTICL